jgi:hypothetical protein
LQQLGLVKAAFSRRFASSWEASFGGFDASGKKNSPGRCPEDGETKFELGREETFVGGFTEDRETKLSGFRLVGLLSGNVFDGRNGRNPGEIFTI